MFGHFGVAHVSSVEARRVDDDQVLVRAAGRHADANAAQFLRELFLRGETMHKITVSLAFARGRGDTRAIREFHFHAIRTIEAKKGGGGCRTLEDVSLEQIATQQRVNERAFSRREFAHNREVKVRV